MGKKLFGPLFGCIMIEEQKHREGIKCSPGMDFCCDLYSLQKWADNKVKYPKNLYEHQTLSTEDKNEFNEKLH